MSAEIPWEQLFDAAVWMVRQSQQHVSQVLFSSMRAAASMENGF